MNLTLIDDLGNLNTPGNFFVFVLSIDLTTYEILYWKPLDERNFPEMVVDPDLLKTLKIDKIENWAEYQEMISIIIKALTV